MHALSRHRSELTVGAWHGAQPQRAAGPGRAQARTQHLAVAQGAVPWWAACFPGECAWARSLQADMPVLKKPSDGSVNCFTLRCTHAFAFVLLVDHIDRGHLPVWNESLAIFIDKKQEAREERTGIACHTHCSACTRTIGLLLRAQWAEEACTRADPPSVQALRQGIVERVAAAGGRVDYVEVPHRPWS